MAVLIAASTFGTVAGAAPAAAWVPNCSGDGKFISEIERRDDGTGNFIIKVHVTSEARRHSAFAVSQWGAVVEEWHAIQNCIPGLEGDLADSIWQQLECHQLLAYVWDPRIQDWATGPTFDLESYRPKIDDPTFEDYLSSKCGGYLGITPSTEFTNPYRPDQGVPDLEHAYDSYA